MDKIFWNYFLALERDLENLSRYIEFQPANYGVFSIELAHLLFAAASEVDVLAKRICSELAPTEPRDNIHDYRKIVIGPAGIPDFVGIKVLVPRYGLELVPWADWATGKSPDWWRSYNAVKHERDQHFNEATLQNVLNAMAGLLLVNFHFYSYALSIPRQKPLHPHNVTRQLYPESALLRLPVDYYQPEFMKDYSSALGL